MAGDFRLSVCVASRGDQQALRRLTSALCAQTTLVPWELILVINGRGPAPGDDDIFIRLPFSCRVSYEVRPGKSHALNMAISCAAGELLIFTDDDVVPRRDWLAQLVIAASSHTEANIFGGRVEPLGEVPTWIGRSSNLQQALLCAHHLGETDRVYEWGQYPIGPNMAVRRETILGSQARWPDTVGPGTVLPVGDEARFLCQMSAAGARNRYYIAGARVSHLVDGRYLPLQSAVRRVFQVGLSAGLLGAERPDTFSQRPARLLAHAALARIFGLHSFRELICVIARATGVLLGRYSRVFRKNTIGC